MNTRTFALALLAFVSASFALYGQNWSFYTVEAGDVFVDDEVLCGGNNPCFQTIQAAIDSPATVPGTAIFVYNGTYSEQVNVTKSIVLKAESFKSIVNGSITLLAESITLAGFNFTGAAVGGVNANIRGYSSGNNISGNFISNSASSYKVYLNGSGNTVENNVLSQGGGDAVFLNSSSGNVIFNNSLTGTSNSGIRLYSLSTNNIIDSNAIRNNSGNGIVLYPGGADYNNITNNNLSGNTNVGLRIDNAIGNVLENNSMSGMLSGASWGYGVLLNNATHTSLINNTANSNPVLGIFINSSTGTIMRNNTMSGSLFDFGIDAASAANPLYWQHDIDSSNKVTGGKSVYVWTDLYNGPNGCSDAQIPSDAGYVALANCRNITVAGLSISRAYDGIVLVNTTSSLVSDALISGTRQSGISIINCSGNSVSNASIFNVSLSGSYEMAAISVQYSSQNGFAGIRANNASPSVYLYYSHNNTISDSVLSNASEGIDVYYSNFSKITNASIYPTGASSQGISMYQAPWTEISNSTVSGAATNPGTCIYGVYSEYVTTRNSRLSSCTSGIQLNLDSDSPVVDSCEIANLTSNALYLNADNALVINSRIYNVSRGFYAYTALLNLTFANNTVENISGSGMDLGGGYTSRGLTIANNTFRETALNTIYCIQSIYDSLIEGNTFDGGGLTGAAVNISYAASSNITVRNNNITNYSAYGIYLSTATNSSISGNMISGISYPIYLVSSTNVSVMDNTMAGAIRPVWVGYTTTKQYFNHTMENNTLDGLPVIYRFNAANENYENANYSHVYLAYSNGISFRNVSLAAFTSTATENSTIDGAAIYLDYNYSTAYPVILYAASNNLTVSNAVIVPNAAYDIYTNANSATFNFINASFRKDNASFASGATAQLNVSWYLDFNVTDDAGPLSGANVSVYYANGTLASTYLTDAQGRARANLSEYVQSATGKTYYSPYVATASYACRFDESASAWLEQNEHLDFALHGEKLSIDFAGGYPRRLIDYKTNPAEIRIYNSTPAGCPGSIASVSANMTGLTNASYYKALSCTNEGAYYSCSWNESNKTSGGYSINFAGFDGSSNPVFSDYEHVQITEWSMADWDYRREFAVNNTDSSTNLTGTMKFQLDTASMIANGSLRSDCSDLRFRGFALYELQFTVENAGAYAENATIQLSITDRDALASFPKYGGGIRVFDSRQSDPYSSAGLQYYLYYANRTEATVWARYNLPAGNATFYLYYGNDSEPSLSNASSLGPEYPGSGLLALYRFDQGRDSVVYDSTGAYNGVAQNNPLFDATDKKVGSASISLSSGSSQYVSIGSDLGSSTSVTFAAWVKPASSGAMTIASSGPTLSSPRLYILKDGSNRLGVYRGGYVYSTNTIPTGSWTHIAVTNDGSTTKMYMNGELVASPAQAVSAGAQSQFYLGYGFNGYFNGKMDDAVVYNRVLNPSEIQELYNMSRPAVTFNVTQLKPTPVYTSADYDVYHHLENCNSANSTVWLKVPPIRAGKGDSVYMYYGNTRLARYGIYELPITINTSGSIPSTEALVYISLNATLGSRITADGRDVRVFTARPADPYGSSPDVEFNISYALSSSSSRQLIVKMQLSNSSPTKTIYLYYGNPLASSALTGFADQFANSSRWTAYDAGNSGGLNGTAGYLSGALIGGYVYFTPGVNGTATNYTYHGRALRYDTQSEFNASPSWEAYDAGNTSNMATKGYYGAYFDGRYVYYAPYYNGTIQHGIALRYDTQSEFNSSSSWTAYDAGNTSNMSTKGYIGLASDGRYIYYGPHYNGSLYHGRVLRYDTQGEFNASPSWTAYDAGNSGGLTNTKGYLGTIFDGRYIYFVPYHDGTSQHAKVLRYDTQSEFNSSSSWTAYDAGTTGGLTNTKGYFGATSDGRYIYFVPYHDGTSYHAKALRYDTQGAFTSASSWSAYDAGGLGGTKGYLGATFDGRYVYYAPYYNGSIYHGKVLRYDTWGSFTSSSSWSAYNANNTSGLLTVGYRSPVFDGTNVYFVPTVDATVYHARVLKYSPLVSLNRSVTFGSEALVGSVSDPGRDVQPTEYLYASHDFRYPLGSGFSITNKNGSVSLLNDSLVVRCAQGANCNFDASSKGAPYVLYPVPDGDWVATVKLENYTVNDFTQAGMMLFDDEFNNIRLARHRCSSGCTYNINGYAVDRMVSNSISAVAGVSNSTLPMYLQILKLGNLKYFSYSYDGVNWVRLYTTTELTGAYVGMFVRNWVTPYNATQAPFSSLTITRLSKTYMLPAIYPADNRNFTPSNARAVQIPDGLFAYWSLDEGSGSVAYDYARNLHTGTLVNSPAWVQGMFGNALSFNGASNYVSISPLAGIKPPNAVTVAVWAKSNTATWNSNGMLVSKRSPYALILHPNQGTKSMVFYLSGSSVSYTSSKDITQWHHYAATYDGSYLRIYEDGVLMNSQAYTGAVSIELSSTYIGCDCGYGGRYFSGIIDEVSVWDRALSASELLAISTNSFMNSSVYRSTFTDPASVQGEEEVHAALQWSPLSNTEAVPGDSVSISPMLENIGPVQMDNITLSYACPPGWACSFNQSGIDAIPGRNSTTVQFNFTVPLDEIASQQTLYLIAENANGTAQASFVVYLNQPSLHWEPVSNQSASQGQTSSVNLLLNNTGAGTAQGVNWYYRCPANWLCSFNATGPANITPGGALSIELNFTVWTNETALQRNITVNYTDVANNFAATTFFVSIAQPNLTWSAANASASLENATTFPAYLNNTGTASSTGINVSVSCAANWTCSTNETGLFDLENGTSRQILVNLTVPYGERGLNLALNRQTTASSSYYPSSRAVDGNTSSYWQASGGGTQWIKINLSLPFTISSINLRPVYGISSVTYNTYTSPDDSTYTLRDSFPWTGAAEYSRVFNPVANVRYVRIDVVHSTSDWYASFYEIGIYTPHGEVLLLANDSFGRLSARNVSINISQPNLNISSIPAQNATKGAEFMVNFTTHNVGDNFARNITHFIRGQPANWTFAFDPQNVSYLESGASTNISFNITVPLDEAAAGRTLYLTVADAANRTSERAFTVNISQPTLRWLDVPTQTADPNTTLTLNLTINNSGAGASYSVAWGTTNCPSSWSCIFNESGPITVSGYSQKNVSLNVSVPYNETFVNRTIYLQVNDSGGIVHTLAQPVSIRQPYLRISVVNMSGGAGETLSQIITVNNTGNFTAANTNVSIPSCPSGWTCSVNATSLTDFAPGDVRTFNVSYTIYSYETSPSRNISVSARDDANRLFSANFTVNITQPKLVWYAAPAQNADPESYLQLNLTLLNNGTSASDSISITAGAISGWAQALNPNFVSTLNAGETVNVSYNATIPYSETSASRPVTVTATDQLGRSNSTSFTVALRQPVILLNPISNFTVNPGDSLTVNMTVNNTGNSTLRYANFTVNCPSNVVCAFNETSQFSLMNGSQYARSITLNVSPSETSASKTITINASDSAGRYSARTFYIYINQPNLSISAPASINADIDNTTPLDFNVSNNGASTAYSIAINNTCPAGWACALNNTLISSLASGASVPARLNLSVPYSETAASRQVNITINDSLGRSRSSSTTVSLYQPVVSLAPISNFTVNPGDSLTVNMTVNNTGTSVLKNANFSVACPANVACEFNESAQFSLMNGSQYARSITLNVSPSETSASKTITINASDSAGRYSARTFYIYINQPNLSISAPASINADIDNTTPLDFNVSNNGASTAYSIAINNTCPAGWACALNNTLIPSLSAGSSLPARLNLTVPYTERAASRLLNITINDSLGRFSYSGVTVSLYQPVLGVSAIQNMSAAPGGSLQANFTLGNSGSHEANVVNLSVNCPSGWTCLFNQSGTQSLGVSESLEIALSLSVPLTEGAPSRTLTVNASDSAGRSAVSAFTVSITQPSLVWVSVPAQTIEPESANSYTITLNNTGASTAYVQSINVTYCQAGWACILNESGPANVSALALMDVRLNVTVPYSEAATSRRVNVSATDIAGRKANLSVLFAINQPYISYAVQNLTTNPGTTIYEDFLVNNTGNSTARNLTLSNTCPPAWNCPLNDSSAGDLAPGEGRAYRISISVPQNDLTYQQLLNITAADRGGRAFRTNFTVTINQPSLNWSPIQNISTAPEATVQVNATLSNNGAFNSTYVSLALGCVAGWSCSLDTAYMENLPVGESVNITANLSLPYSERQALRTLTMNATDGYGRRSSLSFNLLISQPSLRISEIANTSRTPGESFIVDLNITNNGTYVAKGISLNASCPQNWRCNLTNYSLASISVGESAPLSMNVTIPLTESASSRIITVYANDSAGRNTSRSANITLNQPSLHWNDPATISGEPGVSSYYGLALNNSGGSTSYIQVIFVQNCPPGWTCQLNNSGPVTLPPFSTVDVELSLQVPYSEVSANSSVTVAATDISAQTKTLAIPVSLMQPLIIFGIQNLTTDIGANATLLFNATNNGTLDARDVNVSALCPSGWSCSFNDTSISDLDVNATRHYNVSLHVSGSETAQSRPINLTARDSGTRTYNATAVVLVNQAVLNWSAPQAVNAEPDVQGVFAAILNNLGSAPSSNLTLSSNCPYNWLCNMSPSSIPSLEQSQYRDVNFTYRVPYSDVLPNRTITLTATDSLSRNGTISVLFNISQPQLSFAQLGQVPMSRGQVVDLNITLYNNGSVGARNVVLNVSCPTSPNWVCIFNESGPFNLSAESSTTLRLTVGVPDSEPAPSRQVNVSAADSAGRSANLSVLFAVSQPILMFDAVAPANATPGEEFVVDATLRNNGTATAFNVSVNSTCPAQWSCNLTVPALTFNITAGGLTLVSLSLVPHYGETANRTINLSARDSEGRSNFTLINATVVQPRLQWDAVATVGADRGETKTVLATLRDNSTSPAYNITLSSPCRSGWTCVLNDSFYPYLAGGEAAYFEFNATVAANETLSNVNITLNATDQAGRSGILRIPFALNQPVLSWQGVSNRTVSPGADYQFNYTLSNSGSEDATDVSLSSQCPSGWTCLFNQTLVDWIGSGGGSAGVSLSVHVSENETAYSRSASLNASYNGFFSGAQQNFLLTQPNVSWTAYNQNFSYGVTQNFSANLSNTGQENVTLDISAICPSGWSCFANASSLFLAPLSQHEVAFFVLIPASEGASSRNITLAAANQFRNYTKQVIVYVPTGISWTVSGQAANITQTIYFPATLSSTVEVPKSIIASISCPIGWACALNETSFGLEARGNRTLNASLNVPYRETVSSALATLRANDGTRNVTQSFNVTVGQPNITWTAGAQVVEPGNRSFIASISNGGPVDMFLTVSVACPAGWSCALNSSDQLSLPVGATEYYNVSVAIPESEQGTEKNVTLAAADAYRPFNRSVQVSVRAPILQFTGASTIYLNRSQTGVFSYSIFNNGSANSPAVSLGISCPAGVGCNISAPSIPELLVGESVPFTITVNVPANVTGAVQMIVLNATNGAQRGEKNVTLSVGMPSFNITPNASTYYIRKNSNATARITIRNNGTYAATGVMVSSSCPGGWTCVLDWSNQTLAPGQSANATLYLQPALDETGDNIISISVFEQYGVSAGRDIFTTIYIPPLLQEVLISPRQQLVSNSTPNALTPGEFSGDGLMDFIAAYQDGSITLFTNNGRNFSSSQIATMSYPVCGLASGDFDEDGSLDFIAGLTTGRTYVFFRQPDGSFSQMLAAVANNSACGIAAGSFDNDTHLDFVVGMGDNDISLFRNLVASFEYNSTIATVYLPYGMTSGDYNADGRQDLFAGDYGGQLNFIENRMNGSNLTFNITGVYGNIGSNGLIYGLCSGDYELNGTYIDIISGDNSGDIELMRNRNNTYTQKKLLDLDVPVKALACADFDRDGDLDIMAATTQNVTLLRSVSTIHKRFEPFQSNMIKITINISNPFYSDMLNVTVIDNWNNGEVYPVYNYTDYFGLHIIEPYLTDPDGFNSTLPRPTFNGTHAVFNGIYAALNKNEMIRLTYYVRVNSSAVSQFAPTVQYQRLSPLTTPTSYFLSDDVNARESRPNVVNPLDYPYSQVIDEGSVGGTRPDFSLTAFGISDGTASTNTMTNPPDPNAPGYYPFLQIEGVSADSGFSEGKNYTLSATARNTGEVAGMTWITFLVNNVSIGACNVSLPINQSASCSVYWHGPAEGSYNTTAYADYAQSAPELDEDNNGWPLQPVIIQSYADPYLIDFFFTDSAGNPINETYENGGRVKMNITVGNNGTRNATVFLISQNVTGAMYSGPYNGEYYFSNWTYSPSCYPSPCRDWVLGSTASGGGRAPAKIFVPVGSNSSTTLTGGIIAAQYAYGQPYDINVTVMLYPHYTSYPTDQNPANNIAVTKTLRVNPSPPDGDLWHAVRTTSGAGYPYNVTYYSNGYPSVSYSVQAPYTVNISAFEVGNIGGEALNTSISFNLTGSPASLGDYNVSVPPHSTLMLPVDIDLNFTGSMSQNQTVHAYLVPVPNETTVNTNYYNFTIRPLDVYVVNNITLSDLRPAINQTVYIYASVCVDSDGGIYLGPYGPSSYMPTPPFNATVYGNGVPLGTVSVPSLIYGGYNCPQCCHNFQVPYVIPPDVSENFTVTVQADPYDLVEEADHSNNQLSSTFYLFTGRFGVNISDSSYVSGRHQLVNLAFTNGEAFTLPIYGVSIELYSGADRAASLYYSGRSAASWSSPSGLFNIPNRSSASHAFLVYMPDSLEGSYDMRVRVYTAYTVLTQPTNASGVYALLVPGDRGAAELLSGVPLAVNGQYALFTENYKHRMDSFLVSGQNNVSQAGTMYLYVVRSASRTITIAKASEVSIGVE